jgi:hypothetical protein
MQRGPVARVALLPLAAMTASRRGPSFVGAGHAAPSFQAAAGLVKGRDVAPPTD